MICYETNAYVTQTRAAPTTTPKILSLTARVAAAAARRPALVIVLAAILKVMTCSRAHPLSSEWDKVLDQVI